MFTKILVALDGSPGSLRATEVAAALAHEFGASLHALSVIEHEPRYAGTVGEVEETDRMAEEYFLEVQNRARAIATEHGVALDASIAHGQPAHALAEASRSGGYGLLVLGHSGHSRVWGSFLGTTTDKTSRHAACSVLIVR